MSAGTEKGIAPNAHRLLWAGFMAILAAGVGFAIRSALLRGWAGEFGFTDTQLGNINGAGFTGFCFGIIIGGIVADKIGYAKGPGEVTSVGNGWFWAWALSIPQTSTKQDAAKSFVKWATSKDYVKLVAETGGVVTSPPGTRKSTYTQAYMDAAPFAAMTLKAIETADPSHPTEKPVPYTGISFAIIPEYQGLGTFTGQAVAGALAGQTTVEQALESAQNNAVRVMTQAGYSK